MKDKYKEAKYLYIKNIVIFIDNKAELANFLGINSAQVYRWYSEGKNKRHIPERYRDSIIEYAKYDMEQKRIDASNYEEYILEYKEMCKQ